MIGSLDEPLVTGLKTRSTPSPARTALSLYASVGLVARPTAHHDRVPGLGLRIGPPARFMIGSRIGRAPVVAARRSLIAQSSTSIRNTRFMALASRDLLVSSSEIPEALGFTRLGQSARTSEGA